MQCPQISFFFSFKNGADIRIYNFSAKQTLRTLLLGTNGSTFLTISYLRLKSLFFYVEFYVVVFLFPNMIAK